MSKKKQHYVPQVYMKAWETKVETSKEPNKKFNGIYAFNKSNIGEGTNKDSILWKPHLYTVNFSSYHICRACPKIKKEFVSLIYKILRKESPKPVYAKIGYSIIKTKKSISKHFYEFENWKFYYDDGNAARDSAIRNRIQELNCYILENAFDSYFEKNWETIYKDFIEAVHNGQPIAIGQSERFIPFETASQMLKCFFIMMFRNPMYYTMNIYAEIKRKLSENITSNIINIIKEYTVSIDTLITELWHCELYNIFFKETHGIYHIITDMALDGCQMILFEANDGEGNFITSDIPAFEHISNVENKNLNGLLFPLSPKYLLFIARGFDKINIVDHRFANTDTIRYLNNIIFQHKNNIAIAMSKQLDDSL